MIKINKHSATTKNDIQKVFGHLIEDMDNITVTEFQKCIDYAEDNGWENWKNAFIDWKTDGKIPKEEEVPQ